MLKKTLFFTAIFAVGVVLYAQENGSGTFIMENIPKKGVKINALAPSSDSSLFMMGGQDGILNYFDKDTLKITSQILKINDPITAIDYFNSSLGVGDEKGNMNEYISNYYGTGFRKSDTKYGSFSSAIKTIQYSNDSDSTYLFAVDVSNNSRVYLRHDSREKNPQHGSLVSPTVLKQRSLINGILRSSGNKMLFLSEKIKAYTYNWNIIYKSISKKDEIEVEKKPEISNEEILLDVCAVKAAISPDKKIIFYVTDTERNGIYKFDIANKNASLFYRANQPIDAFATDGFNVYFSCFDKLIHVRDEFGTVNVTTDITAKLYLSGPKSVNETVEVGKRTFYLPPGKYSVSTSSSYPLTIDPETVTLKHGESSNINITRRYPIRLLHRPDELLTPQNKAISPSGKFYSTSVSNPLDESVNVYVIDSKTHKEVFHLTYYHQDTNMFFNSNDEITVIEDSKLHFYNKNGKLKTTYQAGNKIKCVNELNLNLLLLTEHNTIEYFGEGNQKFIFNNLHDVFTSNFINDTRFIVSDVKAIKIYNIIDNSPVLYHVIPRSFAGYDTKALIITGDNGFGSLSSNNKFYSWKGDRESIFPNTITFDGSLSFLEKFNKKSQISFYDKKNSMIIGYDIASGKELIKIKNIPNMADVCGNESFIIGVDMEKKVNVFNSNYGSFNLNGYHLFFPDMSAAYVTPGSESSNDIYTQTTPDFNGKKYLFIEQNKKRREMDDSEVMKLKK
ncbi:hypothetical protein [Treponema sp. R80B11-R83G3]